MGCDIALPLQCDTRRVRGWQHGERGDVRIGTQPEQCQGTGEGSTTGY